MQGLLVVSARQIDKPRFPSSSVALICNEHPESDGNAELPHGQNCCPQKAAEEHRSNISFASIFSEYSSIQRRSVYW